MANGILHPIEIKANPFRRDTMGISAFRIKYPKFKIAPGIVIAPCKQTARMSESDDAVPWDLL
jgi:hypothetical protein